MTGSIKGGNGSEDSINGSWKIPYLAEENADEDPEIQISIATETAVQRKAKAVLQKTGKKVRLIVLL